MGFNLKRTYKLRWDDGTDLAGLEIDMRSTSLETFSEMRALSLSAAGDEQRLAEILVDHVVRWNFEDGDGNELPVAVSSIAKQEPVVLREVAKQWYLAAAGVSAPLDLGSTSSDSSAEESIPMETL